MPPRRSTFWLLCTAMAGSTLAQSMVGTVVPLFAVALGLAPVWVGVLVALPNTMPVFLAMPAGRWVDRGGAGNWLAIGAAGMASAPLLLLLAPAAATLALAQLVLGVFQLFAAIGSQAFVADLANGRSLERNYATYATMLAMGRLVGPLVAGLAIDARGFGAAFAVAFGASLWALAMTWWIRGAVGAARGAAEAALVAATASRTGAGSGRTVPPSLGPVGGGPPAPRGARAVLGNVGVQLAILSSVGVFVALSVKQAFFPVALQAAGYPATTIGALISLGALSAVVVRPAMPALSRAFGGPARTLVVAMAAVAVGVGLLGVADSLAAFVVLVVLAGVGTGFGLPLSLVTVASHVDRRQLATALGIRISLNRAAQLVTPVAIGAVIGVAGFGVGFGLAGALLFAVALAVVARVPAFERHETQA